MFKIIGIIFLSASAMIPFFRQNINSYITLQFLKDTVYLAEYFILNLKTGKTYPQLIAESKNSRYSTFDIEQQEKYFDLLYSQKIVEKNVLDTALHFFADLGKHNTDDETEYLKINLQTMKSLYNNFYEKYKNESGINFMAGISAGVIIFIVLV